MQFFWFLKLKWEWSIIQWIIENLEIYEHKNNSSNFMYELFIFKTIFEIDIKATCLLTEQWNPTSKYDDNVVENILFHNSCHE